MRMNTCTCSLINKSGTVMANPRVESFGKQYNSLCDEEVRFMSIRIQIHRRQTWVRKETLSILFKSDQ